MNEAEFWAHVDKTPGCWLWTASKNTGGYGQLRWQKEIVTAHRVAWLLTYGDWPAGRLRRRCRPDCVRPGHLHIATARPRRVPASHQCSVHSPADARWTGVRWLCRACARERRDEAKLGPLWSP